LGKGLTQLVQLGEDPTRHQALPILGEAKLQHRRWQYQIRRNGPTFFAAGPRKTQSQESHEQGPQLAGRELFYSLSRQCQLQRFLIEK
jgi:hypothetical protein